MERKPNMVTGRNFYDFAMGYTHPPLSDDQKAVLDEGKSWYRNAAERENAIQKKFGYNSTEYFRKLHGLLSHPEAEAYAPDVVRRARRVIEVSQEKKRAK